MSWSHGHSGERRCLACGGLADTKPPAHCSEDRHRHRYQVKVERNAAYRRERRAAARAQGTVYRGGRGDMEAKAERQRAKHAAFRESLYVRLGMRSCQRCGIADERVLQFDHIEGDGWSHRRSLPSGSAYYRYLGRMPDPELRARIQVLCANCNIIKRIELAEWRVGHAREVAAPSHEGVSPPA